MAAWTRGFSPGAKCIFRTKKRFVKDYDLIDFIATDKDFNKKNNQQKFDILLKRIDINDFVREYSLSEPFISDIVSCSKSEHIKRAAMALAKQINKKPHV